MLELQSLTTLFARQTSSFVARARSGIRLVLWALLVCLCPTRNGAAGKIFRQITEIRVLLSKLEINRRQPARLSSIESLQLCRDWNNPQRGRRSVPEARCDRPMSKTGPATRPPSAKQLPVRNLHVQLRRGFVLRPFLSALANCGRQGKNKRVLIQDAVTSAIAPYCVPPEAHEERGLLRAAH